MSRRARQLEYRHRRARLEALGKVESYPKRKPKRRKKRRSPYAKKYAMMFAKKAVVSITELEHVLGLKDGIIAKFIDDGILPRPVDGFYSPKMAIAIIDSLVNAVEYNKDGEIFISTAKLAANIKRLVGRLDDESVGVSGEG